MAEPGLNSMILKKHSGYFLDKIYSNFFLPYIAMRSQVTSRSKALTANIISNATEEDTNSSNITNTIADHYAQFDFSNINTALKWRKKT